MNIFKSFGFKKASPRSRVREYTPEWDDWARKRTPEHRGSSTWRSDDDELSEEELWQKVLNYTRARRDAEASQPEPGEGVPVKGRKPTDVSDKDPYKNWNVIGGRKGQTLADTRAGRSDVGGSRTRQRDPMPYEDRGKDFGVGGAYRKPKSSAVSNMFKAFGLKKDEVSGKNYGGGKLSPSSEKQEDQHPDEDKKKTPNGGENGE